MVDDGCVAKNIDHAHLGDVAGVEALIDDQLGGDDRLGEEDGYFLVAGVRVKCGPR